MEQLNTRVVSACRPIRIAFLVEDQGDTANTAAMFDAIFADCFSRWGGRFNLLIPASAENGPMPEYVPWLRFYDPDIIYSYVDLSADLVTKLHEDLSPSALIHHQTYKSESGRLRFRPRLPIECLSSAASLPELAVPSPFTQEGRMKVLDSLGPVSNIELTTRSFGHYSNSYGRSFVAPYTQFADQLVLVTDEVANNRGRYLRPEAQICKSESDFITAVAGRRAVSLSQLSARRTLRLEVGNNTEFNIFVGNTFVDFVQYWNSRSLLPTWIDGDVVDLLVPQDQLINTEVVTAIGKLLAERNGLDNDRPRFAVRSSSVPESDLKGFAEQLHSVARLQIFQVQADLSLTHNLPSVRALISADAPALGRLAKITGPKSAFSGSQGIVATVPPQHLKFCPPWLLSRHNGSWAVDLAVSQTTLSETGNSELDWQLPRRLRFASLMIPQQQPVPARATRNGFVTTFSHNESSPITVRLPEKGLVIDYALRQGRDWLPFSQSQRFGPSSQAFADVRQSGAGKNLEGVAGLLGGIEATKSILLHEFWQKLFADLGGSPSAVEYRREKIREQVERQLDERRADGQAAEVDYVTQLIVREAEKLRGEKLSIEWTAINERFKKVQRDSDSWKNGAEGHTKKDIEYFKESELRGFISVLQQLCLRGAIQQGYSISCPTCQHKTWLGVEQLRVTVSCEVCSTYQPIPLDKPWSFRLNEFLRESLRKQGVLPLVWALDRLTPRHDNTTWAEGPFDVYVGGVPENGAQPLTDIDLTCVSQGRVTMCEVKQSAFNLSPEQLDRFSEGMRRARPDVAALAIMEPASEAATSAFKRLQSNLSDTSVRVQLLTLDAQADFRRDVIDILTAG